MKSLLAFIACVVCKITHGILRLLNKGGTALPGKLALKICPEVLEKTSRGVSTLMVTGTNGKTTSVRMAETALQNAGLDAFSNRSGANLIGGIACEFIVNTNLFVRPKKKWAVIECDEAAARQVFRATKPKAVLVTNLFKDQLDRYGTLTTPRDAIAQGLSGTPETLVCLNADCPMAASIADKVPNEILWYGMSTGDKLSPESGEESRCVNCGAKLHYGYVTYANLGGFCCPKCGARRHDTLVTVSDVLPDGSFVISDGSEKTLAECALPGLYNIYNAAGVTALMTAAGAELRCTLKAVSSFECGFGRMEEFALGKLGARMILIKNAAAADQTLETIRGDKSAKSLVFAINDRPADGTDISWLDDADFGVIRRMRNLKNVYCTGDRSDAMAQRLEREGVECETFSSYAKLLKRLRNEDAFIYILPTYTAMLEMRQELVYRLGGKNFWE